MFSFIPAFHRANALSFCGLILALAGIYNSFAAKPHHAIIFLVLASVCDLFDGIYANRFNRSTAERQMGEHVDSLVDVIISVALPIVLLCQLTGTHLVSFIVAAFYALMAIHRLAYFHLTKEEGYTTTFTGVPVTYIGLIVPIIYTLFLLFNSTTTTFFKVILSSVYILMALAFVWDKPIPKPRGKMYAVFVLLALTVIVILVSRLTG